VDALIDEESTLLTRRRHREGLIQLLSRLYEVDVTAEAMGPWGHGAMGPWGHGAMGPWGHGVFKPGIWVDIGGWFFIVSFSVFF